MKINNEEINIDDLINQKYMHKRINNDIFLSDYQIDVLNRFNINPYNCVSVKDLLFLIDEVLDEEDDEELDSIEREITEFNYYANTNK